MIGQPHLLEALERLSDRPLFSPRPRSITPPTNQHDPPPSANKLDPARSRQPISHTLSVKGSLVNRFVVHDGWTGSYVGTSCVAWGKRGLGISSCSAISLPLFTSSRRTSHILINYKGIGVL